MIVSSQIHVPKAEMDALWRQLSAYAVRYDLTGADKDQLVEQTFIELSNEPDILIEKPLDEAIAETMHRVFMRGKQPH